MPLFLRSTSPAFNQAPAGSPLPGSGVNERAPVVGAEPSSANLHNSCLSSLHTLHKRLGIPSDSLELLQLSYITDHQSLTFSPASCRRASAARNERSRSMRAGGEKMALDPATGETRGSSQQVSCPRGFAREQSVHSQAVAFPMATEHVVPSGKGLRCSGSRLQDSVV